jgi:hypothetical protein
MGATFTKPRNLKMSDELFQLLGRSFDTFFAHWVNAVKVDAVNETIKRGTNSEMVRWSIFWAIDNDLRYDDTHPRYSDWVDNADGNVVSAKVRIVPYNDRYKDMRILDDLTSAQIDNALKAIFKEFSKDLA